MDFRFLYNRTKYFILSPVKAWEVVHRENRPINYVRGSFFLPLVILVSISSFSRLDVFYKHHSQANVFSAGMHQHIPLSDYTECTLQPS